MLFLCRRSTNKKLVTDVTRAGRLLSTVMKCLISIMKTSHLILTQVGTLDVKKDYDKSLLKMLAGYRCRQEVSRFRQMYQMRAAMVLQRRVELWPQDRRRDSTNAP